MVGSQHQCNFFSTEVCALKGDDREGICVDIFKGLISFMDKNQAVAMSSDNDYFLLLSRVWICVTIRIHILFLLLFIYLNHTNHEITLFIQNIKQMNAT